MFPLRACHRYSHCYSRRVQQLLEKNNQYMHQNIMQQEEKRGLKPTYKVSKTSLRQLGFGSEKIQKLREALTPFPFGGIIVMLRESPSLAQIGGDLSMCTQIFLGTTATIPQKQDPLQPSQSQSH